MSNIVVMRMSRHMSYINGQIILLISIPYDGMIGTPESGIVIPTYTYMYVIFGKVLWCKDFKFKCY